MYQIITLFTLNLHMFYVIITSIKLEKAKKKKDNNEAPPGLSPSGDLPRPWQVVLPKQPHPAFPRPQPSPLCGCGIALPRTGTSVLGDTEEQLSCITEKNARGA